MTPEFTALFTAKVQELTGALRYYHKPTGTTIAPQVIHTMLPARSQTWKEGEECPFVRFAIYKMEVDFRRRGNFKVAISAGIYTGGTIQDGTNDIMELVGALSGLADHRGFAPYKLQTPFSFEIGEPNPRPGSEGLQPHPYYYACGTLQFNMP
ncbi:hypothetical protein [Desulfogranum japonicum]|uniref:hypothetical protein n=1 Tax=Desulfogranum japonicum TaxID=231447 RepID=UPI00041DCC56|nr:hypothetical protein [Desulfogranum japonicum]